MLKIIKERDHETRTPAEAKCECGTTFSLQNQYMGACSCPGCGQWYNLFGQELLPPEAWRDPVGY